MGAPLTLSRLPSGAAALLLLLHLPAITLSQVGNATTNSTYLTFSFPSFDTSEEFTNLTIVGDAGISQGALQLTPDTLNSVKYLVNKSGRVLLRQPLTLWQDRPAQSTNSTTTGDAAGRHVASFNTNFSVNVYRIDNAHPGEGFAFIIASGSDMPAGSDAGFLGLTNATLNGNPNNHLVAVEFDTVKQSYDPDDNHVGLDINNVVSNATASLTPFDIEIAPLKATNYTIWIDYDGSDRHIWVYMAVQGQPKPSFTVLNSSLDLGSYVLQNSYFGFSASTGSDYQLNCILSWSLTVEDLSEGNSGGGGMAGWKLGVAIGVPVAAVVVVAGLLVFFYVRRRPVRDDPSLLMDKLKSLPGQPKEFMFDELKKATNNFDEKLKLGQGGFGMVYKAVLPGDNPGEKIEVAVKKFSRDNSKGGQDDFIHELSIINRLRHKHLVRLVGWCHKNGVLLLVYDYMPNGSLDHHLFRDADTPLLSWERRYNIIAGVASALHYLHNEYDQKVVHRDLKASNVMLDASFHARLGDFGLARAIDVDKTSYTERELAGVPGTMGYIAPECFHTGRATRESDVFAFGAVVLETVCGRRPRCDIAGFQFLADWVWKLYRERRLLDAVDPRLAYAGDYVAEDVERLLLLGLACSLPTPSERPTTAEIVQIISRSAEPPEVPPFKPSFVWPAAVPMGEVVEEDGDSSRLTSTVVTSSYYASSSGWTPRYIGTEGHVEAGDAPSSMV
ncbi:probable L-type lectin-domain containing receptor kinase S.5 [Elaeis guineensis]|uniref:non-specific serine/threonine protein kinase n=1 Tax=Elaeis guineensis var. tenera TaxID=51953 RepID=A0A6I9RT75_ELAGV|nr:probable L-type lectin-domain containing receptor kinase S.5 [Elaeis guineensis]